LANGAISRCHRACRHHSGLTWQLAVVRKLLGRLRKHMQEDVGDLERVKRLNTLERRYSVMSHP